MFAPQYVKEVDIITKFKDFSIAFLLLICIFCKLAGDTYNYDVVYFIILLPFITLSWYTMDFKRKIAILSKIKHKTLKLEVEYEVALFVIMTLVRDSMGDSSSS